MFIAGESDEGILVYRFSLRAPVVLGFLQRKVESELAKILVLLGSRLGVSIASGPP